MAVRRPAARGRVAARRARGRAVTLHLLMRLLLLYAATAQPPPDRNPGRWFDSMCPCRDKSLCRSLSPQPHANRSETVVFPRSLAGQYGAGRSDWRQYDWSKVSTVVLYDNLGSAVHGCHTFEHPQGTPCLGSYNGAPYPNFCCIDAEIMCAAHANGARVLVVSGGVGGCNGGQVHNASAQCSAPADTSGQPIVWFASQLHAGVTPSHAQIDKWAAMSAQWVKANGFDGAMLDIEGSAGIEKGGLVPAFRATITYGLCALKVALEKEIPGSLLTWAGAATPFSSGVHGFSIAKYGFVDPEALNGKCFDYLLPGAYCTCTGGAAPAHANLTQLQEPAGTLTRGSAPMSVLENIIASWGAAGVTPDRLVLNMPWFACDFKCADTACNATVSAPLLDPDIGGVPCGFSWGAFVQGPSLPAGPDGGPGYVQVLKLQEKIVPGSSIALDEKHQTKSFLWSPAAGQTHQVTFDDPETYHFKYEWAKQKGFRGLAFWGTDATDGDQIALRDMWGAVPPRWPVRSTCTAALTVACPPGGKGNAGGDQHTVADIMKCDECAGKHQGTLRRAGCTAAEIQSWCISSNSSSSSSSRSSGSSSKSGEEPESLMRAAQNAHLDPAIDASDHPHRILKTDDDGGDGETLSKQTTEWWRWIRVSVQDCDGSTSALVSSGLQQSQHLSRIVCRDMQWLGPFDADYGRGLETEFPVELAELTPASLPQTPCM